MNRFVLEILAFIALCLAVFGIFHQHITTGVWFDYYQLWCHEDFIAVCIIAAIALMIGKYLGKIGL